MWLTILLGKLLRLLVRDVSLGLQVCFVSYENDHLRTQDTQEEESRQTQTAWTLGELNAV